MQPKAIALRKRSQIAKENRRMFMWVTGASVLFGFAIVISAFLVKTILFNEKVLQEKSQTQATLKYNNEQVDALKSEIRALDANQALIDSKAKYTDETLQVILDALPSEANSLALGASLQKKLLFGIDGLTLESLQVNPVVGIESLDGDSAIVDEAQYSPEESPSSEILFNFSISGNEKSLTEALANLEKSIRTIDIISFKIENQGNVRLLTAQARAFYEPAVKVELKDKVIKQ